ncbi:hypothetical protein CC78DRAFT_43912 [Lojkania enalia]|uniref:Uncharacterized protein n=1 Tax=Lojkania enalia TaxID=147567 RepID=A0A9P4K2Y2_9PLEO|nr:hypothetical protein CC78DRAFT_43912 [Didymosphaeria enalia]
MGAGQSRCFRLPTYCRNARLYTKSQHFIILLEYVDCGTLLNYVNSHDLLKDTPANLHNRLGVLWIIATGIMLLIQGVGLKIIFMSRTRDVELNVDLGAAALNTLSGRTGKSMGSEICRFGIVIYAMVTEENLLPSGDLSTLYSRMRGMYFSWPPRFL